jgi:hypothetical protein
MLKHTPLNCKTCELGEMLSDNEVFKIMISSGKRRCAKCSELLIFYVGRQEVQQ